ncbi:MAG: type II secretion system F family protein [Chloroflexota bacterium]
MTTTLIILAAIVIVGLVGTVALVRVGLRAPTGTTDIQSRLEEYASRSGAPLTLEEIELSQPFSQRVIRPMLVGISKRLGRLSPAKSREALEQQLEMAGKPNNWGAAEFFGLRIFVAVVMGVLLFLFASFSAAFTTVILVAVIGALLGFFMPVLWLRSKIRQRQTEIIKSLPDALDLLTITVEAGMGFDGALQKVASKWDNHLSKGFSKVVQEMRLGIARREALKNMERSMGVPDVTTFVAAIIQAEQLGVSIAKILRVQSEQMRIKRRQRAEELANKAPIKMLFPMAFLIFPALFIILLGPAALIIMETPGLVGG